MKKTSTSHFLYKKYHTLYQKLSKSLQTGRFATYSAHKKAALLHRLERYESRLIRKGITVAGVATLMLGAPMLHAQGALPFGSEFPVNTYTTSSQRNPSIAVDSDGDFIITWESYGQDGSSNGIYAQRYASGGSTVGGEFRVNSYTTNLQINPSIGVDSDGDFIIAWQSFGQDFSSYGIYAQRYASDGSPVGNEFKVNTYFANNQSNPSIGLDSDGDFIITWQSLGQDNDNWGIYAQRYANDGSPVGSEFQVNSYTTDSQRNPSIAVDSDGDFVITWQSEGQDGAGNGIYAQRYASDGSPVGNEFKVNTYFANNQSNPSIGLDSDGDFIITWSSYDQDGSNYGIYAQRYTSGGSTLGGEFQVNSYTTNVQFNSNIGVDSDGDFIITWRSFGQDGSSNGIYAQRYASDGSAVGSEFQVNSYTIAVQTLPNIAVDNDGDFVITWQSSSQDGDNYGIYAQRYAFVSLPVELLNFKGVPIKEGNQLQWTTASETDNAGFQIERSETGKEWKAIGYVAGKGTTLEQQDYAFLDDQITAGLYYYRLKQIDIDGAYAYSEVITLQSNQRQQSFTLAPNPTTHILQVYINQNNTGNAALKVLDFKGSVLLTQQVLLTKGQQVEPLNVQSLAAGTYFLQVQLSSGVEMLKFVKL